jgi:DUF4097 and DUF4098 domain-containing protein YvlB
VPDQVLATISDGKVTVELPDERYDVSTTTGDGQVTVAVPRDSSSAHQVTVHTNDGSVTVRGL